MINPFMVLPADSLHATVRVRALHVPGFLALSPVGRGVPLPVEQSGLERGHGTSKSTVDDGGVQDGGWQVLQLLECAWFHEAWGGGVVDSPQDWNVVLHWL